MNEDTMKKEIERIFGVALKARREAARLTGYSPAHVCYASRGLRISRPLRAKMRELGLKFKEVR